MTARNSTPTRPMRMTSYTKLEFASQHIPLKIVLGQEDRAISSNRSGREGGGWPQCTTGDLPP